MHDSVCHRRQHIISNNYHVIILIIFSLVGDFTLIARSASVMSGTSAGSFFEMLISLKC